VNDGRRENHSAPLATLRLQGRTEKAVATIGPSSALAEGEDYAPAGRARGGEKLAGIRSPAEAGPKGEGFPDEILIGAETILA
jgi:hypothetical protein